MKNRFTKYVDKNSVVHLKGKDKREVLEEVIFLAADRSSISIDRIRELTWKREKMMTTGVGFGLALPHIRLEEIPHPVIICGLCENPIIDYGSQDEKPVRVILYIMAPSGNQESYLELLGSVSAKMRDEEIINEIVANFDKPSNVLKVLKRRRKDEPEDEEE
ncbi:MAG: PTS sugar transporter subunit IIA [Victivallales bacterium]|nr:PTS sugar transporter subunit IIA [Victivallales bacterium]